MMKLTILILLCAGFLQVNADCNRRIANDSFYCVCTSESCDFPGPTPILQSGDFLRIISSRDNYRFDSFTGESTPNSGANRISVDPDVTFQAIKGFGGAFTDATGINVNYLTEALRDAWVRSYFSPDGIEYDLCRVPIAGSDFSTYAYSYDEVENDIELEFFALTEEDYTLKLPYIRSAMNVSDRELLIFGSPWAPPPWMKVNGMHNGSGGLLPNMWDPYSNYLVKFVEAYESEGVPIWGLTPVNEPLVGFEDWAWNALAFSAEDMRDWLKTSFGPIFTAAGYRPRVQVMILDHNRDSIADYTSTVFDDADATQYVDGTAVHWYADYFTGPEVLTDLNEAYPEKFILYTESCEGWSNQPDERVVLGSWQRAENYASNILDDLENYSTGWVDWNMALDITGAPNWAGNFVDSPTLVNPEIPGEFYKQPMFYAMGHFSKWLSPGSVRLQSSILSGSEIQVSSYMRPEGDYAVVILNKADSVQDVELEIVGGQTVSFVMDPKSLETVIFF